VKGTIGLLAAGALAFGLPATAQAKPCEQHAGREKAACVKQAKRNAQAWPPRPAEWEIKRRIGTAQWNKAVRVAYCETGGNWNHYPHGRWIGGLGMFRSTYGIGQAVTGYRWVSEGATRAEQIAIGHIVATRFGWSAWGCGSA